MKRPGFTLALGFITLVVPADSIFQWAILGRSYPGAALVVGPVLIGAPYAAARALANRFLRLGGKPPSLS